MLKNKKIIIAIKDFSANNIYKQPWFWVDKFAKSNLNRYEVLILTNVRTTKISDLKIIYDPIFFDTYRSKLINEINPDKFFLIINSLNILFFWRYKNIKNLYFIMASSRFKLANLRMLSLKFFWLEKRLLFIPVLSSLIPFSFIKFFLKLSNAKKILFMSKDNFDLFRSKGFENYSLYNKNIIRPKKIVSKKLSSREINIIYLGPPLFSRGVDYVLNAFNKISKFNSLNGNKIINLHLYIRFRKSEMFYDKSYKKILEYVNKSDYKNNITISNKYLSKDEIEFNLKNSHVALLPFKITLSDLPLVVYEAGQYSMNLIVLNTNGVSEIAKIYKGYIANHEKDIFIFLVKIIYGRFI